MQARLAVGGRSTAVVTDRPLEGCRMSAASLHIMSPPPRLPFSTIVPNVGAASAAAADWVAVRKVSTFNFRRCRRGCMVQRVVFVCISPAS